MLRAGTGDRAACQLLVERHLARIVTFAHRTLGNRSDAELADPRPEPSLALHGSEVASHVSAALATLPETQRIAVTLCHYQGLRNTEAAEIMSVSVEALESLLARGRRALRARLGAIAPALLREG